VTVNSQWVNKKEGSQCTKFTSVLRESVNQWIFMEAGSASPNGGFWHKLNNWACRLCTKFLHKPFHTWDKIHSACWGGHWPHFLCIWYLVLGRGQGYINKTWGVPLTPKDRLDEWSNTSPQAINKNHVNCHFTSYSNKFGYQLALC